MEDYLIANGNNYDGTTNNNKIAKSLAATNHWSSSSYVGTPGNTDYPTYRNKSGFTALPAGGHYEEGGFYDMGHWAMWWTSTELNSGYAYYRYVVYDSPNEGSDNYKKEVGFSVRCVRD